MSRNMTYQGAWEADSQVDPRIRYKVLEQTYNKTQGYFYVIFFNW